VDPRAGLGDVEKRKLLTVPGPEFEPLGLQSVASRYTDCAIPSNKVTSGNIVAFTSVSN
jgi:hypothetical protein